ncbi:MAG: hypothetical protein RLN76_06180 [Phycisphaeraceae bacterium]
MTNPPHTPPTPLPHTSARRSDANHARPWLTGLAIGTVSVGVVALAAVVSLLPGSGEVSEINKPEPVASDRPAELAHSDTEITVESASGGSLDEVLRATEDASPAAEEPAYREQRLLRLGPSYGAESAVSTERSTPGLRPVVVERTPELVSDEQATGGRYARIAQRLETVVEALERVERRLGRVSGE